MTGGVYKIDKDRLDSDSIELLQGLGVPISQTTNSEIQIQIDSLPLQTRQMAEKLFFEMGFSSTSLNDYSAYWRFGNFSDFIVNSDGKPGFSAEDKNLLLNLYRSDLIRQVNINFKYYAANREKLEEEMAIQHYFVNPEKYPQPARADILFPGEIKIGEGESIYPQDSAIPKPASEALDKSALPLTVFLGNGKKRGYMTCVGQKKVGKETYVIYATAEHNLDQIRALHPESTYKIDDKVVLAAFTPDRIQTPAKVVKIADNVKPTENFIYTVQGRGRGLGSDPKYINDFDDRGPATTYRYASPEFGKYMLFRGTNKRGDSGSPVVDAKGRLVGILLGGDDRLTVIAYADMNKLKKSVDEFMMGLK